MTFMRYMAATANRFFYAKSTIMVSNTINLKVGFLRCIERRTAK